MFIFAQPVTQRNLQGVGWWWFKILLMFHPENVGKKSNFEEYVSVSSTTTEIPTPQPPPGGKLHLGGFDRHAQMSLAGEDGEDIMI